LLAEASVRTRRSAQEPLDGEQEARRAGDRDRDCGRDRDRDRDRDCDCDRDRDGRVRAWT
jgi:hypothetical protein